MTNSNKPNIAKIGNNIVNFSELRNEGYIYVDKTKFVHEILSGPDKRLFLSRPRRFGKTLLIDTLEEAAVGRKELFAGLAIDRLRKDGDWPRYHVLRIGMSRFGDNPALLDWNLTDFLHSFASRRGFTITGQDSAYSLTKVITSLSLNYADIPILTGNVRTQNALVSNRGKIIVLIDEYDAPIINNIMNTTNINIAKKTLHSFYNALKSCDDMIERVFITGITKFAQLSVFSAMNNLSDITFQPGYATICGFTPYEISTCYSVHLDKVLADFKKNKKMGPDFTRESLMKRIVDWYDGYSWNGKDRVINPISLQKFLLDHIFNNYWIQTGGINFLNQMNIKDDVFSTVFKGVPEFSGSVDIQDAGNADPVAVMLQAGYLTVRKRKRFKQSELYLAVPNKEVGMTIMKNYIDTRVISSISPDDDNFTPELCKEFCNAFCQAQSDRAEELLHGFLSAIPYTLHEELESFYHLFLLSIFKMSRFKTIPERITAKGIADLVITSPEHGCMVTEIKYGKSSINADTADPVSATGISDKDERKLNSCIRAAFRQILKNDYLLPYVGGRFPVRAVAVAVCGRNRVRIRSFPAEELIQRAQEFLGNASRRKIGAVTSAARNDEPPQNPRSPRQRRSRQ
ncbi:MAG: ATP-binding protein [Deltaproteobacteria bacterium]|jgi:hypothetical protein|nr:ATP-binding protein [Deltaproteobacteria bacterium]